MKRLKAEGWSVVDNGKIYSDPFNKSFVWETKKVAKAQAKFYGIGKPVRVTVTVKRLEELKKQ